MKKIFFFIIMAVAVSAKGQTLKEILYSGKLKSDTGTVIRKGDDLSSKIDTSTKKTEPEKLQVPVTTGDSLTTDSIVQGDSMLANDLAKPAGDAAPKDNNQVWKDFITELTETLKLEVLNSNKVKKGSYSVLIEYEIDTEGQVSVKNVSSDPANSYLEQQITERITLNAPQMEPLPGTNGKPRKAVKKYTLVLTK